MDVRWFRALRWVTAGLGVLVVGLTAASLPSGAASSSLDVGDQAVVNVFVRGRGNEVTVRVWDRPTVQVDYDENAVPAVDHRVVVFGTLRSPLVQQIPSLLYANRDPSAGAGPTGVLPPEEFPFGSFRPGPHETVKIDAPEGAHLVLTVPATTGILALRVGGGQTSVEGYRGANLVVVQNSGRVQITGATTNAFVQMSYGTLYAADGSFERIRVRGVAAHDVFERCRSRQIEASSISGSMVYDGGSFDPGLARFESLTGSIALGVTSAAQLNGRSQDGRVFTMFERRGAATIDQRGEGEAVATVGSGGPLVNAISGRGNVYFYEGTLAGKHPASPEWRAVHQLFNTRRRPPRIVPPPPPPPAHARRADTRVQLRYR